MRQSCYGNVLTRRKLKEKLTFTVLIIERAVTRFSMAEDPFDGGWNVVGDKIAMNSFQEIPGGGVPARAKPTYFERHMGEPP